MRITWNTATARQLERRFPANSAPEGIPVAELVGAVLGAHAQVLSAAELSVGRSTGQPVSRSGYWRRAG